MELQDIIVYLILACAAGAIIHHVYRQLTGKHRGCNCSSCPHRDGQECHCHDTAHK